MPEQKQHNDASDTKKMLEEIDTIHDHVHDLLIMIAELLLVTAKPNLTNEHTGALSSDEEEQEQEEDHSPLSPLPKILSVEEFPTYHPEDFTIMDDDTSDYTPFQE